MNAQSRLSGQAYETHVDDSLHKADASESKCATRRPLVFDGKTVAHVMILCSLLYVAHLIDTMRTGSAGHLFVSVSLAVGVGALLMGSQLASVSSATVRLIASLPVVVSVALLLTGLKVPLYQSRGLIRLTTSWVMATGGHSILLGYGRDAHLRILAFLMGHLTLVPLVESPAGLSDELKSVCLISAVLFGGCMQLIVAWMCRDAGSAMEQDAFEAKTNVHELQVFGKELAAAKGRGLVAEEQLELSKLRGMVEELRVTSNGALMNCFVLEHQRQLLASFVESSIPKEAMPPLITKILHRINIDRSPKGLNQSDSTDESSQSDHGYLTSDELAAVPGRVPTVERAAKQFVGRPNKSPARR